MIVQATQSPTCGTAPHGRGRLAGRGFYLFPQPWPAHREAENTSCYSPPGLSAPADCPDRLRPPPVRAERRERYEKRIAEAAGDPEFHERHGAGCLRLSSDPPGRGHGAEHPPAGGKNLRLPLHHHPHVPAHRLCRLQGIPSGCYLRGGGAALQPGGPVPPGNISLRYHGGHCGKGHPQEHPLPGGQQKPAGRRNAERLRGAVAKRPDSAALRPGCVPVCRAGRLFEIPPAEQALRHQR